MSKLFGKEEHLPFAPAAGAINGRSTEEIIEKILDVARSQAGAVKWGSTTMEGGLGNDGTTYHHNEATGQSVNAMGLPNIGHHEAVKLQKELQPQVEEYGKPLIPSFSPGVGENPLEVLPAMASGFVEAGAEIIEVNYSCPNKPGEGDKFEPVLGHDLDTMFGIDERIRAEVGPDITVIRKLPPYVGEKRVLIPAVAGYYSGLAEAGVNEQVRVVLVPYNTVGNQSILTEEGEPALSVGDKKVNMGGASGIALRGLGRKGLKDFRSLSTEAVGLISTIGVTDGQEVYHRVNELGADFTEGVTVFWENEKKYRMSFGQTISKIASEYAQAHEQADS